MSRIFIAKGMQAVNNWCVWKLESDKRKMPYDIKTGRKLRWRDKSSGYPLNLVLELLQTANHGYSGLGFLLDDGMVYVDVDRCIDDDGVINSRGQDILNAFPDSYAEISQSGYGIHILTKGIIPRGFNNRTLGVEMYPPPKFCAYTGRAIQAREPTEEQAGLNYVFNKYSTRKRASPMIIGSSSRTDDWIIRHASGIVGHQGKNFRTLFSGDTSGFPSASEADSALCTLLAFWCDRDPVQIDRIFRQSCLYRPKWEREDYRRNTISHACGHIPETLSEWMQRNRAEVKDAASVMNFLDYGS